MPHLPHVAEGPHAMLTLQLPQQGVQGNEGARAAHASTRQGQEGVRPHEGGVLADWRDLFLIGEIYF